MRAIRRSCVDELASNSNPIDLLLVVTKALETIVGLGNTILWPVAWANERSRLALERNLERYRRALVAVPEEKVVGVRPEIGVPIAEKLGYVQDDRLAQLYVQLLAAASNSDSLGDAHPSFVNVINNLSPDEAHLLEYFQSTRDRPFVHALCRAPGKDSHVSLQEFVLLDSVTHNLVYPKNAGAYLSNIAGLGLVQVRHDAWLADITIYAEVEEQYRQHFLSLICQQLGNGSVVHCGGDFSSYGFDGSIDGFGDGGGDGSSGDGGRGGCGGGGD